MNDLRKVGEQPGIFILEVRDRGRPDEAPIAVLLIERQEAFHLDERGNTVLDASISLSYVRITSERKSKPDKGCFYGSYSSGFGGRSSVSLTSSSTCKGAVFLELPGLEGQHIGTYLMNEIVTWAKRWPEANVRSVELRSEQADASNKARRNRFYERFGLVFDYKDAEQREGQSKLMLAEALTPVETWKANVRERSLIDYLSGELSEKDSMMSDILRLERANKSLRNMIKHAEDRPLRWALRRIGWRSASFVAQCAVVLMMAMALWSALQD